MFRRHRDDLIASFEREREAMQQSIRILADQVDYLRYQVAVSGQGGGAHMSPVLEELKGNDFNLTADDDGFRPYMTEEEEELLAMRLNDLITEQDLREIQEDLAPVIKLPTLEPDE